MTLEQLNFPLVSKYRGYDLTYIDYDYYLTTHWLFEPEEWAFELYYHNDNNCLSCLIDLKEVIYRNDDSKTLLEPFFTNDTTTT